MSWSGVREWLALLRRMPPPEGTGLSRAGAHAAKEAALDAWSEDVIARLEGMDGEPFARASIVAVRTVFTAPLEWVALLLGRGTRVRLKVPRQAPGWGPDLFSAAKRVGLPLELHLRREAIRGSELVVAMGRDETISAIGRTLPDSVKYLGFGHRFSIAWIQSASSWPALAEDLALYDGRGCFSPAVVFTPIPLREACEGLSRALEDIETRWPRGELTPIEGARIRSRSSLARVVGHIRRGTKHAVHGVPAAYCRPLSLPRAPLVVEVRDAMDIPSIIEPFLPHLSTIGSDVHTIPEWTSGFPGVRFCPVGRMQRPSVFRLHDGVDWIRETWRCS